MGYNTTMLILNDAVHTFPEHAQEFADGVYRQVISGKSGDVSVGSYCNPITVMKTMHADVPRVYITHCNGIMELSDLPEEKSELYKEHWKKQLKLAKRLIRETEQRMKEEEAKAHAADR